MAHILWLAGSELSPEAEAEAEAGAGGAAAPVRGSLSDSRSAEARRRGGHWGGATAMPWPAAQGAGGTRGGPPRQGSAGIEGGASEGRASAQRPAPALAATEEGDGVNLGVSVGMRVLSPLVAAEVAVGEAAAGAARMAGAEDSMSVAPSPDWSLADLNREIEEMKRREGWRGWGREAGGREGSGGGDWWRASEPSRMGWSGRERGSERRNLGNEGVSLQSTPAGGGRQASAHEVEGRGVEDTGGAEARQERGRGREWEKEGVRRAFRIMFDSSSDEEEEESEEGEGREDEEQEEMEREEEDRESEDGEPRGMEKEPSMRVERGRGTRGVRRPSRVEATVAEMEREEQESVEVS